MRALTHALAALYAACAIGLAYPAYASWQHHAPHYAAFFAACSVLLATSTAHHAYSRDEIRALTSELERAYRPAIPDPAPMPTPDEQLVRGCCEVWWATAGADHDPDHCTRKDHHA